MIDKVRKRKKRALKKVCKISTIYPFALKIKFLDNFHNSYFSTQFQN